MLKYHNTCCPTTDQGQYSFCIIEFQSEKNEKILKSKLASLNYYLSFRLSNLI